MVAVQKLVLSGATRRRCNSASALANRVLFAAFGSAVGTLLASEGTDRDVLRPRSNLSAFAIAAALALSSGSALAQQAVISGRVTGEQGQPLAAANVFITEMSLSVGANDDGTYRIVIPAERVRGQTVLLRARAIGHTPLGRQVVIAAGEKTENFLLKQDINRLSDVVVTGTVGEGTERSKVPYAVSRLTTEDLPVPALDPITALSGKMPGVRIAQTGGRPGSNPEIMMRGPRSINATGRSQQPLIIVDGAVMNVGSLDEIGGLDIESVEVVKGAAGASLYGSTAANGVIVIKTKRGGTQEGVKFNVRSEYGFSDNNSIDYGQPINHNLQLDETGKRFCVTGAGASSPCSRTLDWMKEMYRINNVNADTTRTQQTCSGLRPRATTAVFRTCSSRRSGLVSTTTHLRRSRRSRPCPCWGSTRAGRRVADALLRQRLVYRQQGRHQSHRWPAATARSREPRLQPAPGRAGAGVELVRQGHDGSAHGCNGAFGQILRGAPAGTDYLARDTLGRYLVRGGGAGFRPTGNGGGTFLYDAENRFNERNSNATSGTSRARTSRPSG